MKTEKILSGFDKTIGVKYELVRFSSDKELADNLKNEKDGTIRGEQK